MASATTLAIVIILLTSLMFSAFFSGMEIAFVSANRLKVELDKKQGGLASRIISKFVDRPKRFIAAMLVGNNVAMVFYSLAASELIIRAVLWLGNSTSWGWVTWLDHTEHYWVSMLVRTALTTILVLFAAEFIPKAVFRVNPNRWLNIFALPLQIIYFILWLPAAFVTGLSNVFIKLLFKAEDEEEVSFGKVDLDHYLQLAVGNVDSEEELDHEIQILQNALDFSNVKARDCMIPRNEIIAHSLDTDLREVTLTFVETGLSKVLIFRDSIDNIIGYVHSYELFKKPENIKEILLPVAIVPEPMPANEVLAILIRQKRNMAVVLDEFGGTAGIVTMEDIVEEIFGEIEDEHDSEELEETQLNEHEFLFSARHE
ncbi:MAG: HlyC/CorC family transporter, partial [Flavobacteriales bacterium]|nr:HlyC/CorC family transporter [Flavobacteriales bacterium]